MKTATEYQLQACWNLLAEFTARGDREAADHFLARIRQIQRKSAIRNSQSEIPK